MAKKKQSFSRAAGFAKLWREVMDSPAYRDLSSDAKALLIEFSYRNNGNNNGSIFIPVKTAMELLGKSKKPALKAFKELESHGFLALTNHASWQQRIAREYRITSEPCGGREPTDDFKNWSPKKIDG